MHSWRKTLVVVLTILFVGVIFMLVFVNLNYLHEITVSHYESQQQTTDLWEAEVKNRLNGVATQLHQLMNTIYTNSDISETTPVFSPMERQDYKKMMDNILSTNKDIDALYVKVADNKAILFISQPSIRDEYITTMRKAIEQQEIPAHNLTGDDWDVIDAGENDYLIRNVELGKYQVGALCNIKKYDVFNSIDPASDYSLMLYYRNKFLQVGGSDWSTDVIVHNEEIQASKGYLVTKANFSPYGFSGLFMTRVYQDETANSRMAVILCFSIFLLGTMIYLIFIMIRMIYQPTNVLIRAIESFGKGNLEEKIADEVDSTEFNTLFTTFNEMTDQIRRLKVEVYEKEIEAQREELVRLRAQIRPHFYLNAITTISNMTYTGEGENIREYLNLLAKYMRYMMELSERSTTIGDELTHINNYLAMQRVRLPNSVYAYIGCPDTLLSVKVPYLLIFTIVENSVKHALDPYSTLQILIQCEHYVNKTFAGTRIIIEDSGKGFSKEDLETYNDPEKIPEVKEHIGLSNVVRTLSLTYGRKDLFKIANSIAGGAHVELLIPDEN